MSFASPVFWGAYGKQLRLLAESLLQKRPNLEIVYLYLDAEIPKGVYDFHNFMLQSGIHEGDSIPPILQRMKYIGGIKKRFDHIYVSNLNALVTSFDIDAIVNLCDLNKFVNDTETHIACTSIAWYPNHFSPMNRFNIQQLHIFSHIAALCPTDKALLQSEFPDKTVEFIPHIMEGLTQHTITQPNITRKKWKIPQNAFLILINSGNYDRQNRKSLDTSLFAVEKFIAKYPNAFLFCHAFNIQAVTEQYDVPLNGFFQPARLLDYLTIPRDRYILNEKLLEYQEVLDLMSCADVLLQGSKSEGFGIPVLEAQLLATPVVTTQFGAMKDFTFFGISVPPLQRSFDYIGQGIWAMPHVDGMVNAMCHVYNKDVPFGTARDARKNILESMSQKAVATSFLEVFESTESIRPPVKTRTEISNVCARYNASHNAFTLTPLSSDKKIGKSTQYIRSRSLSKYTWIIFLNDRVRINNPHHLNTLLEHSTSGKTNILLLKTVFPSGEYPTIEHIKRQDFQWDKMYYAIRVNLIHCLLRQMPPKQLRTFILKQCLSRGNITITNHAVLGSCTP
jgi:glycosyltransferase involved in cell wall biosynthesis